MVGRRHHLPLHLFLCATLFFNLSVFAQAQELERLHFLIPGGAGGGWDQSARGVGEVLTKSQLVRAASFENLSGGGGGRALAYMIETADRQTGTLFTASAAFALRNVRGQLEQSYRELTPIASVVGDYGAIVVLDRSEIRELSELIELFKQNPKDVRIGGGSVRGGFDHLLAALVFQTYGADPKQVKYVPYDAGGKSMVGLLSGEITLLSTGVSEALDRERAGQVRILCVSAPKPQSGHPSCGEGLDFVNWRGFFGPPGLDPKKADELSELLREMYDTAPWKVVQERYGWVPLYKPRAEFETYLDVQEQQLQDILDRLGIQTAKARNP